MRFNRGDLAILAIARTTEGAKYIGATVEIAVRGPIVKGINLSAKMPDGSIKIGPALADADYLIVYPDYPEKTPGLVSDWQLRPRQPPKEPEALHRSLGDIVGDLINEHLAHRS